MTPDDARQREHEHKERSGSASAEQGNGDCLLKMGDRIELHIFWRLTLEAEQAEYMEGLVLEEKGVYALCLKYY